MIRSARRLRRPLLLLALLSVGITACGGSVDSGSTRVSVKATPVPVMSAATARSNEQLTTGPTRPTAHSTHVRQEPRDSEPGHVTYTFSVTIEGEGDIPEDAYIQHSLMASGTGRAKVVLGLMCGSESELPRVQASPCQVGRTHTKSISAPIGASIHHDIHWLTYKNVDGVACPVTERIMTGRERATASKTFSKAVVHVPTGDARVPGERETVSYSLRLKVLGKAVQGDRLHLQYGWICRQGDGCPASLDHHIYCGPALRPVRQSDEPCKGDGTVYGFRRAVPICGMVEHDVMRTTRERKSETIHTVREMATRDTIRTVTYQYPQQSASERPAATAVSAPSEPTYDIRGYISVTGGPGRARPCTFSARAADGGWLVVKDQDGRVLGQPSPAPGPYRPGKECAVPYTIEDVPRVESYNFYLLANPKEVYASYAFEEMIRKGWTLDFTFAMK